MVATAYTGDDDLRVARSEGLLAVLPKPVPIARVLQLLRAARRDGLVVLVEDDEALSDNLSEALRLRGFTAITAGSVLETQHLGHVQPFAAIVDLRIPGGPDGQAMRQLNVRLPDLPILVITGIESSPPVPAEAVFRKPFSTEKLLSEIDRLYETRKCLR